MVFDVSVALTWILFLALFPIGFVWLRRAWRILFRRDFSEVALRRGVAAPDAERFAPYTGILNLVAGGIIVTVIGCVVAQTKQTNDGRNECGLCLRGAIARNRKTGQLLLLLTNISNISNRQPWYSFGKFLLMSDGGGGSWVANLLLKHLERMGNPIQQIGQHMSHVNSGIKR